MEIKTKEQSVSTRKVRKRVCMLYKNSVARRKAMEKELGRTPTYEEITKDKEMARLAEEVNWLNENGVKIIMKR